MWLVEDVQKVDAHTLPSYWEAHFILQSNMSGAALQHLSSCHIDQLAQHTLKMLVSNKSSKLSYMDPHLPAVAIVSCSVVSQKADAMKASSLGGTEV